MTSLVWRITPLVLLALLAAALWRVPDVPAAEVRYLRIAAGPTGTLGFQTGTALAGVLSRPPGLPPCRPGEACGVPGLVALAQSLPVQGDIAAAVAGGKVETGIATADAVHAARCPADPAAKPANLTLLGDLYGETLHVLVRPGLDVTGVEGLKGRRVAIGKAATAERRLADRLLTAHGLRRRDVRAQELSGDDALAALAEGKVDALFRIAAVPDPKVAELAAAQKAVLLPVAGEAAGRLSALHPFSGPGKIPAGTYGEAGAVETLDQPVVWVAGPDLPASLAGPMAEALAAKANRVLLTEGDTASLTMEQPVPARPVAPLHPGAAAAYGRDPVAMPCQQARGR